MPLLNVLTLVMHNGSRCGDGLVPTAAAGGGARQGGQLGEQTAAGGGVTSGVGVRVDVRRVDDGLAHIGDLVAAGGHQVATRTQRVAAALDQLTLECGDSAGDGLDRLEDGVQHGFLKRPGIVVHRVALEMEKILDGSITFN